ncbi:ammonia-forming cytochrome c nitrite reductase subunit c552 [Actinomyces minihominis]|uniref:ammonia-forming cytochrome c nitrite reductase subunit c552 n=1 Tax=Actinomyces minihominis TaxID=2002838 RepID=UPI001F5D38BF|nr:ammonia-forming cytochrome c nitrite reductase subunit c552 [Actinomyces minihominis]
MSEKKAAKGASTIQIKPIWVVLIIAAAIAVTFTITALLMSILQHQQESATSPAKVTPLTAENMYDPAAWGQNFPSQYEGWLATEEFTPANHSQELVEHDVEGDPRTEVTADKTVEDPRLKVLWAGYPFATEYRHARGHAYMTLDQAFTRRQLEFNQPGTCINCHASMVGIYEELGDGNVEEGFLKLGTMPLPEVLPMAEHPVSCIDCHNPDTMELRITRPAFETGIAKVKLYEEGIENYDVNRDATRNEMRSYVCAQCHVEYYFAGEDKVLVFPWSNGLDIDGIWETYQENGHVDWIHADTGAEVLKAQHPEFDVWSQGVHAANGVSCSDCHMPYQREGSGKISNHQITSPVANYNAACGACHDTRGDTLKNRVDDIQSRFVASRDIALDAVVALIKDLTAAQNDGTPEEYLENARMFQNKASFYVDYLYSENSYGFHAPDYSQRVLNQSLDAARKGQLVLRGVPMSELEASDVSVSNAAHGSTSTDAATSSDE